MTFRDTENNFDLPPEKGPRAIIYWKAFRGIASCTREEFCIVHFCTLWIGVIHGLVQGRSRV